MSNDLYFIPLLEAAFERPCPGEALRLAFQRIDQLGDEAEYRKGYCQFLRFMELVRQRQDNLREDVCVPADAQGMDGDAPEESVCSAGFVLEQLNGPAVRQAAVPVPGSTSLVRITPGRYSLHLETGRLLWTGSLRSTELLWEEAYPGEPLQLAADTAEDGRQATRELVLLDGEVVLRVLPGLESGCLEIIVNLQGRDHD